MFLRRPATGDIGPGGAPSRLDPPLRAPIARRYNPQPMRWSPEQLEQFRAAYEGKRVCLTGGAGFIGGHLAEALVELDAQVVIVDDLSGGAAGADDDAPDVLSALLEAAPDQVRFLHASILDTHALDDAMERVRVVFHLAAISSLPESMRDPDRAFRVNDRGTFEVCSAAQVAGARRIIYAASSSAYGDAGDIAVPESRAPAPLSPYAASKLAGEHVVSAWARSFGLPGLSMRLFNVYGPRQRVGAGDEGAVVAAFIERLRRNQPPEIFGDGLQTRDFIHVHDVVTAMLLAGSTHAELRGQAVNIGTGRATTINDLAHQIAEAAERPELRARLLPARDGDLLHSRADVSLARSLLGFEATIPLAEGLRATVEDPLGNALRTGAFPEAAVRTHASARA